MKWSTQWWRDDEDFKLPDTGLCCPVNGEVLHFTDEVFLLQVVQPLLENGNLVYVPMLDNDGDYLYFPFFFSFMGWEDVEEGLREWFEDELPIRDPEGILECDVCGSDIFEGEATGLVQFGEIHVAKRQPTPNEVAQTFDNMGDDKHLCVRCLMWLDIKRDDFDAWSRTIDEMEDRVPIVQPFPGAAVCRYGIETFCWRDGYACECEDKTT